MTDSIETQAICHLPGNFEKKQCFFPNGQFCGLCDIGIAVEKILKGLVKESPHSLIYDERIYVCNQTGIQYIIALGQAITSQGETVIF